MDIIIKQVPIEKLDIKRYNFTSGICL